MNHSANILDGKSITFIGGGNMATSMVGGLVNSGFAADAITVSDPNAEKRQQLLDTFGVRVSDDNGIAVKNADVVILAVKPQMMKDICEVLSTDLPKGCLVMSIAAGITCKSYYKWLSHSQPLVRVMPNTPSMIGLGASGMFANTYVSSQQMQVAEKIMSSVGIAHWVKNESLIDVVTAVSGSGPAYFFLMIEAMTKSAMAMGLKRDVAEDLAIQTAVGAGHMAQKSKESVSQLRRNVTSPNGTTEKAIFSFQNNDFSNIVKQAMTACAERAEELGAELDS